MAGCLFVERRSRLNLDGEISEITRGLENNINVTVFPEATSTNGESVLRFKRPLFRSALNSQVKVLPLCINYLSINQTHVSLKNRDSLFWYDDMSFFPHLWNFLEQKNIHVSISYTKPIDPLKYDSETMLSVDSHNQVKSHFAPIAH